MHLANLPSVVAVLASTVGAAATGVSIVDPDWRIVAVNAALTLSSVALAAWLRSSHRVTRRRKPRANSGAAQTQKK